MASNYFDEKIKRSNAKITEQNNTIRYLLGKVKNLEIKLQIAVAKRPQKIKVIEFLASGVIEIIYFQCLECGKEFKLYQCRECDRPMFEIKGFSSIIDKCPKCNSKFLTLN